MSSINLPSFNVSTFSIDEDSMIQDSPAAVTANASNAFFNGKDAIADHDGDTAMTEFETGAAGGTLSRSTSQMDLSADQNCDMDVDIDLLDIDEFCSYIGYDSQPYADSNMKFDINDDSMGVGASSYFDTLMLNFDQQQQQQQQQEFALTQSGWTGLNFPDNVAQQHAGVASGVAETTASSSGTSHTDLLHHQPQIHEECQGADGKINSNNNIPVNNSRGLHDLANNLTVASNIIPNDTSDDNYIIDANDKNRNINPEAQSPVLFRNSSNNDDSSSLFGNSFNASFGNFAATGTAFGDLAPLATPTSGFAAAAAAAAAASAGGPLFPSSPPVPTAPPPPPLFSSSPVATLAAKIKAEGGGQITSSPILAQAASNASAALFGHKTPSPLIFPSFSSSPACPPSPSPSPLVCASSKPQSQSQLPLASESTSKPASATKLKTEPASTPASGSAPVLRASPSPAPSPDPFADLSSPPANPSPAPCHTQTQVQLNLPATSLQPSASPVRESSTSTAAPSDTTAPSTASVTPTTSFTSTTAAPTPASASQNQTPTPPTPSSCPSPEIFTPPNPFLPVGTSLTTTAPLVAGAQPLLCSERSTTRSGPRTVARARFNTPKKPPPQKQTAAPTAASTFSFSFSAPAAQSIIDTSAFVDLEEYRKDIERGAYELNWYHESNPPSPSSSPSSSPSAEVERIQETEDIGKSILSDLNLLDKQLRREEEEKQQQIEQERKEKRRLLAERCDRQRQLGGAQKPEARHEQVVNREHEKKEEAREEQEQVEDKEEEQSDSEDDADSDDNSEADLDDLDLLVRQLRRDHAQTRKDNDGENEEDDDDDDDEEGDSDSNDAESIAARSDGDRDGDLFDFSVFGGGSRGTGKQETSREENLNETANFLLSGPLLELFRKGREEQRRKEEEEKEEKTRVGREEEIPDREMEDNTNTEAKRQENEKLADFLEEDEERKENSEAGELENMDVDQVEEVEPADQMEQVEQTGHAKQAEPMAKVEQTQTLVQRQPQRLIDESMDTSPSISEVRKSQHVEHTEPQAQNEHEPMDISPTLLQSEEIQKVEQRKQTEEEGQAPAQVQTKAQEIMATSVWPTQSVGSPVTIQPDRSANLAGPAEPADSDGALEDDIDRFLDDYSELGEKLDPEAEARNDDNEDEAGRFNPRENADVTGNIALKDKPEATRNAQPEESATTETETSDNEIGKKGEKVNDDQSHIGTNHAETENEKNEQKEENVGKVTVNTNQSNVSDKIHNPSNTSKPETFTETTSTGIGSKTSGNISPTVATMTAIQLTSPQQRIAKARTKDISTSTTDANIEPQLTLLAAKINFLEEQLHARKVELTQEKKKHEEALQNYTSIISNWQNTSDEQRKKLQKRGEQVAELSKRNTELQESNERQKAKCIKLMNEGDAVQKENRALQAALDVTSADLEISEKAQERITNESNERQEELAKTKKELGESQAMAAEYKATMNHLEACLAPYDALEKSMEVKEKKMIRSLVCMETSLADSMAFHQSEVEKHEEPENDNVYCDIVADIEKALGLENRYLSTRESSPERDSALPTAPTSLQTPSASERNRTADAKALKHLPGPTQNPDLINRTPRVRTNSESTLRPEDLMREAGSSSKYSDEALQTEEPENPNIETKAVLKPTSSSEKEITYKDSATDMTPPTNTLSEKLTTRRQNLRELKRQKGLSSSSSSEGALPTTENNTRTGTSAMEPVRNFMSKIPDSIRRLAGLSPPDRMAAIIAAEEEEEGIEELLAKSTPPEDDLDIDDEEDGKKKDERLNEDKIKGMKPEETIEERQEKNRRRLKRNFPPFMRKLDDKQEKKEKIEAEIKRRAGILAKGKLKATTTTDSSTSAYFDDAEAESEDINRSDEENMTKDEVQPESEWQDLANTVDAGTQTDKFVPANQITQTNETSQIPPQAKLRPQPQVHAADTADAHTQSDIPNSETSTSPAPILGEAISPGPGAGPSPGSSPGPTPQRRPGLTLSIALSKYSTHMSYGLLLRGVLPVFLALAAFCVFLLLALTRDYYLLRSERRVWLAANEGARRMVVAMRNGGIGAGGITLANDGCSGSSISGLACLGTRWIITSLERWSRLDEVRGLYV